MLFSPTQLYFSLYCCAGCYLDAAAGLHFYAASSQLMRWRLDQAGAFWKRMWRLKGQEAWQALKPAEAAPPPPTTAHTPLYN